MPSVNGRARGFMKDHPGPSQPRLPGRPSDLGLVARAAIPAELEHPGIVPAYEHGAVDDGRSWHR